MRSIARKPNKTTATMVIKTDGVGNFIYTITDNRVTRLAVNIGLSDSGRTEVTAGLSKETPVVTTYRGAPAPGTAVQPPVVRGNS